MSIRTWPELYRPAKNGKYTVWKIEVDGRRITTTHGTHGDKLRQSVRVVRSGKNLGRANATTPEQQAVLEAEAKHKRQISRRGYSTSLGSAKKTTLYYPMLAATLVPGKTKLHDTYIAQPKLDGCRALVHRDGKCVTIWTRNRVDITHIHWDMAQHLHNYMLVNGFTWLDGEFYNHDMDFEDIVSGFKAENEHTYKLQFHVFDVPSKSSTEIRMLNYDTNHPCSLSRIQLVPQVKIKGQDYKTWHDFFVSRGYEGLILREVSAPYLWNYRGKRLLKYKEFIDEEFRIIGYKQGVGADEGCITWICRLPAKERNGRLYSNSIFDAKPRGSVGHRRSMFINGWKYVGKLLTVRYQERTSRGVPKFPVGISIRDYE